MTLPVSGISPITLFHQSHRAHGESSTDGLPGISQALPKIQSWFRFRHSTETAVLKVMSDILSAADRGRVSLLGLPDISAAFDTVGHDILSLHRMESSFDVGGTVLSWIRSFLQGRTQQVYSGRKASNVDTVTSGVPQGRVIGPLFCII